MTSDPALHTYNTLVGLPLSVEQRCALLASLHRFAQQPAPPRVALSAIVSKGPLSSLSQWVDAGGSLDALCAALCHPTALTDALQDLTAHAPQQPAVHHPHPLGEDARFPPRIAKALNLEATTVRGRPRGLSGFPFTDKIVHFRQALREPRPASAVIVGAGYVGCEVALAWAAAGCHVSLIDRCATILRGYIPERIDDAWDLLRASTVDLLLNIHISGWDTRQGQIVVYGLKHGEPVELSAERVVLAVGLRPEDALHR
ncbi:MAG: FAD-dependent oxidoreductase [Myxococcota bacterium]